MIPGGDIMKANRDRIRRKMGVTEHGLPETPRKMSNVRLSGLANGPMRGCDYCFPHGQDTDNATARTNRRSWKRRRAAQHRRVANPA